CDAEGADGLEGEGAPDLVAGGEPRVVPIRQHPFTKVVDPLEVLAAGDHELAGGEEGFEGALFGLPLPPPAGAAVVPFEVRGADGPVSADVFQDAVEHVAVSFDPILAVLPPHPRG